MKKFFTYALLLAVALTAGFALAACDDDDDPAPVPEDPAPVPEVSRLINAYVGATTGSSQHFNGLKMPGVTDTVYVTASATNSSNFDVVYSSSYWGKATFTNVAATKADGLWTLAQTEGVILMPNRNPGGGGEGAYKEYPATLESATIEFTEPVRAAFTINADLGERAGIYTMVFSTEDAE